MATEAYRVEQATGRITVILGGPVATAAIPPVPPLPERPPTPPAPAAARESREPMHPAAPPTVPPLPSPSPSPAPATAPPPAVANPPARPKTPPPAASRPVPGEAPSALPAKDLERYKRQVAPTLDRLRLQQPLLMSLEGSEPQTVDRVQLAAEEFERLRQELIAIKSPPGEPPVTARHAVPVHDVGADGDEADARGRAHVRSRDATQCRVGGRRRDAAPRSGVRGSRVPRAQIARLPPLLRAGDRDDSQTSWRHRRAASGHALRDREGLRPDADRSDPGGPSRIGRHRVARRP